MDESGSMVPGFKARYHADQYAEYDRRRAQIPESTMELARRAMKLMSDWGWGETFVGDEGEPESWLEALLHEASHAVEAGLDHLPLTKELPLVVGKAIPEDRSVEAEARALATEWFAWGILGLPWEWGAIVDLADVQQVPTDRLFEEMFEPSAKERLPRLLNYVRDGLGCVL